MRRARVVGAIIATALVAAAAASSAPGRQAHAPRLPPPTAEAQYAAAAGIHKIKHVIIIMQENRSFDNYFGTYPHADGIPGLAGHPGKVPCIPDPKRHKCVKPFHDTRNFNSGGPYSRRNVIADINHGKMNGFIKEQETLPNWSTAKPTDDVMGYHTGKELPNYWTYARDFVLQDHMFEPVASYSLPSHLFLVSLWSARCKNNDPASCHYAKGGPATPPGTGRHPHHKAPIYAWTDLTYLLNKYHVSWRFYIFKGIEPDCETNQTAPCKPVRQGPKTNPYWNPLRYFTDVRQDRQLNNIQSLNSFFSAVHKGRLPAVSWIVPNLKVSEHPRTTVITLGQTYVTGLINTIMESPDWKSCAIFLAWDDFSGLYDNMRPPHVDQQGYGMRVPGLVISPYARRGFIDHQILSFDAYAKFIEDDFLGGQRLDPRTDGRPDPRPDVREDAPILGNLIKDFNFKQSPRGPVILSVHPKTDLIGG